MEVGGLAIANNGTVQYRGRHRLAWYGVLADFHVGQELPIRWRRGADLHEARLVLHGPTSLVKDHNYDHTPSYFVFGGLVFQPLTLDYLREWRDWWEKAPRDLVQMYYRGMQTEARREIIVLTSVLADRVNMGYEDLEESMIERVGDQVPRDLAHFVSLLESARGLVHLVAHSGSSVVIDADLARASAERIATRYRIPADRSPDLQGSAKA
ncbi:MAG: hypothetical protein R3F17_06350 [Planctomycetota bacterium]